MRLFNWLTSGRPPETLSGEIAVAPTVSSSRFNAEVWELEPDNVISLREKLSLNGNALHAYACASICRGVLSGLTEAYVINQSTRDKLVRADSTCERFIRPFVQGTHLRPWYVEEDQQYLIALRSSCRASAWTPQAGIWGIPATSFPPRTTTCSASSRRGRPGFLSARHPSRCACAGIGGNIGSSRNRQKTSRSPTHPKRSVRPSRTSRRRAARSRKSATRRKSKFSGGCCKLSGKAVAC